MLDLKHQMKIQRAMRSWERVAQEIDATDLLEHVDSEQVENTVYHGARDRERIARAVLLRMREALRAGGN